MADYGQFLLGDTGTYFQGLAASATTPTANMVVNLDSGYIIQQKQVDQSAYGSLPTNTLSVMQLGRSVSGAVTLSTSGLSSGQSRYALIQAGFIQSDAIRAGDPDGGVLPYININNPTQPFNGPNNSGTPQNTVRQSICDISVVYGDPATTGSEVPPSPSSGYVAVWLVDLSFGQTQITNGEILNPNAVPGSAAQPLYNGILHTHHQGILGQAPQIVLDAGSTQEVQGHLPTANMVASSATGAVACMYSGSGDPNGSVAGNNDVNGASDVYWDNSGKKFWVCDTTGNSSTAHWTDVSNSGVTSHPFNSINTQIFASSGTYTPTANTRFIRCRTVGGGAGGGGSSFSSHSGSSNSGGGGGGGAGGTAEGWTDITLITTPVTVTIGAGGVAGTSGANGTFGGNGGDTSFGSYLIGNGGAGGQPGQSGAYGIGGSGGGASASVITSIGINGGAGGSAGNNTGGTGGNSTLGGGGYAAFTSSGAAQNGGYYGGGGGGAAFMPGQAGTGHAGVVIVEEFIGP
jgi:hypothetical protein